MATLADVARRAGVSQATASRIVNGSSKPVTEELRARVLRAVADLQYVPNAQAQQLARTERSTVGLIVADIADPYFAEITRGVQRVAGGHGRLTIVCDSFRDPRRELEYLEQLRAHQAAAIVLAGSGYHDAAVTRALHGRLDAYTRAGGRVCVIDRAGLPGDAVLPDNDHGGWLLADELYRLGHRRIGVLAGPKALTVTTDRLAGIRRAARDHGRSLAGRRVGYAWFDRDSGATATADLLERNPDLTALIALTDTLAVGALTALRRRGVPVPDGCSVTGFDDTPPARDTVPALTTVRIPLTRIGAMAMALALDGPPGTARVEKVPVELVRRESTGPPVPPTS